MTGNVTATLTFSIESDSEDLYGNEMPATWGYPTKTVDWVSTAPAGVELIGATETTATITITAEEADIDYLFSYGAYAAPEGADYADVIDVYLLAGEKIEPTADDLLRSMRDLLAEALLDRPQVDADLAQRELEEELD